NAMQVVARLDLVDGPALNATYPNDPFAIGCSYPLRYARQRPQTPAQVDCGDLGRLEPPGPFPALYGVHRAISEGMRLRCRLDVHDEALFVIAMTFSLSRHDGLCPVSGFLANSGQAAAELPLGFILALAKAGHAGAPVMQTGSLKARHRPACGSSCRCGAGRPRLAGRCLWWRSVRESARRSPRSPRDTIPAVRAVSRLGPSRPGREQAARASRPEAQTPTPRLARARGHWLEQPPRAWRMPATSPRRAGERGPRPLA